MTNPTLGFAVIGTGMIAGYHAQAIAQTPGARLVGVVSRSPGKGRAFADQHHIPVLTATVEEMIARPDVHVVNVTTPSGAHLAPALAAIKAGKHVMIEKPLEITPDRVDQITTAADAAGVKVAAIFQGRFGAGAQRVKSAVASGRLGRLVLASAYVKWHRTTEYYKTAWKGTWDLDGGGALMNQAIHNVDLLLWLLGNTTHAFGFTGCLAHERIEVEDTAVAGLRFESGALGVIQAATSIHPGYPKTIAVHGDRGSAVIEQDEIRRWDFAVALPDDAAIRERFSARNVVSGGASDPSAISHAGHRLQLEDFVRAIREGRPPQVDGREGRRAVAAIAAIYESARTGRSVAIENCR